jgi:hypothetical protein
MIPAQQRFEADDVIGLDIKRRLGRSPASRRGDRG